MKRINALTIAGTDPSGGAGIQADLKTFSALGAYGAQLLLHWWRKIPVVYSRCIALSLILSPPSSIRCSAMCESTPLKSVCWRKPILLKRWQNGCNVIRSKNVVLDTVMLAKSGDPLLSPSAVATLRSRLLPQVSLITPNLPEAAALLDAPHARTEQEMLEQGRSLLAMGCGAVLMKGGHLDDEQSPDWLFTREGEQRFTAQRIMTKNTHGTGCTLSAALAALRPRHTNWADTVQEAKSWLSSALAQADTLEVGHGIGPVHHFHAWW